MPDNDDAYFVPEAPRSRRGRQSYDDLIERHARDNQVDPNLIRAVMSQESGGNPQAVSPKNARGLMQLIPATAARFGTRNIHDPDENIRGGARYLKFLNDRFKGNTDLVLAAYNAGEGAVDKFGGIPPYRETRNYVPAVKARYQKLGGPVAQQTQAEPDDPYFVPEQLSAPPVRTFPRGTTRGKATGPAELVRRRPQPGQVAASGLGATRPLATADLRQRDEAAIQQTDANRRAVRAQVERERMANAPAPARLFAKGMRMFGPQGVPLLTAVHEVANTEDALVNEEVNRRLAEQRLAETPEVVAGRQEFGAQAAPVRALTMPAGRAGANIVKTLAGLANFGGIRETDVGKYLNKRATVLEQSASLAPLDAAGAEIVRGLPEKAGGAVLDVGFTVGQLIAMKRATGLSLSKIMMLETALRTSDLPVKDRATQVAQAGVMGRALDVQMSRAGGAAVNVVPTLAQEVPAVAAGQRDPYDAAINVGVQAGVGALLTNPRRAPQLQPMPEVVTREAAPPLRPSELSKRVALRGDVIDERFPTARAVPNTEGASPQDRPLDTARQTARPSRSPVPEPPTIVVSRQSASESAAPSTIGGRREPTERRGQPDRRIAERRVESKQSSGLLDKVLGVSERTQEVYKVGKYFERIPREDLVKLADLKADEFAHLSSSEAAHGKALDKLWSTLDPKTRASLVSLNSVAESAKQVPLTAIQMRQAAAEQLQRTGSDERRVSERRSAERRSTTKGVMPNETRVETQQDIQARAAVEESAATIDRLQPQTEVRSGEYRPPTARRDIPVADDAARARDYGRAISERDVRGVDEPQVSGVEPPQWQHRDFGLVTESPNQSSVGRGRVRVTAEDGSEHVILKPKGTGAGNQIAIPVREAASTEAPAAEGGQKPPDDLPRRVRVAGAEFEVVAKNPDGTLKLRSEGGEFDTAPGEKWTPITEAAPVQPRRVDTVKVPRKQFQNEYVDNLRRSRQVSLMEAEDAIRKAWNSPKPLPVGIDKVSAFLNKSRFSASERKLRTQWELAKRNLEADTRSDFEHAGRVWDVAQERQQPTAAQAAPPKKGVDVRIKELSREGNTPEQIAAILNTEYKSRYTPEMVKSRFSIIGIIPKTSRQGGPTEPAAPPPAAVKPARKEAAQPVRAAASPARDIAPSDIQAGDYVRSQQSGSADLTGEIVSIGRANVKVRTYYNPGGLAKSFEQIHTVPKSSIVEVKRAAARAEVPPLKPPPVEPAKAPEPSQTSARKAGMAADREVLDLPDLPPAARKSWRESLAEAKPESANRLADEVLANPRGLSDAETASVVVRAQQVKNEHAAKMAQISAATDADVIARLRSETAALEAEFDKLTTATKASGTEKGRTLAAQKLTINQDFDLVSVKARLKAAKGRPLTEKEDARVEQMVKQVAELEVKLAEANNRAQTAQLQKQIDRVKRQTKRGETKQVLDAEFAALKQQFAQAKIETRSGVQGSGLAALDPEGKLTVLIAKMARNRVKAGVVEAEKLVDEVYGAISDRVEGLRREDVRDSILAYGFAEGRERTRQTVLLKTEADLSRRLEQGDFSKVERVPPIYTRETAALQRRIDDIKQQFERERYRATRSSGQKVSDELAKLAGVPKTIKSIGDLSAVFRQGGYYAITHPIRGGALPFRDMIRSFSDAGYRNVENIIQSHPKYEQSVKDGVEYTGVNKDDPRLHLREEGFLGKEYLDYIPLAKQVKDFSERTFVSFLDSQRINMYDVLTDGLANPSRLSRLMGARGGLTGNELKADRQRIAKMINSATGRGNLGKKGNQAAPLLNVLMFSPRLVASRVQLLNTMFNPVSWARMPRNARAQILQDNVKFLAATTATLTLMRHLGADVTLDPDDSEFLKIRIGDTTYDTLTGLQQPLRYLLNMTRALSPVDSKTLQTGEHYAGTDAWPMTVGTKTRGGFLESKASPTASAVIESVRGSNFLGRKRSLGSRALDLATPLPAKDVIEGLKQGGLLGALQAVPALTGIGVGSYPAAAEKPVTLAEKLARKLSRPPDDKARDEEDVEESFKISELRARSRRGEDVSAEIPPLNLTERQQKTITDAKGQTRLQQDFKRLTLENALRVWSVASADERTLVKPLLAKKADAVDQLDESKQAVVKAQLRAAGIVPVEELPADKQREILSSRRGERREQARQRREKQRGQPRQRPSQGYGY